MRWHPAKTWKGNLYIISFGELIPISGFAIISAFLPYYVEELGVTDARQVAISSALGLASAEVALVLVSPLWGWLADRFGSKLILDRAMGGEALTMMGMAFVRSVRS